MRAAPVTLRCRGAAAAVACGDYMEWFGSGWLPVNLTNDAYKLAVNYIVYGMSR
jgi:hypothetical protein